MRCLVKSLVIYNIIWGIIFAAVPVIHAGTVVHPGSDIKAKRFSEQADIFYEHLSKLPEEQAKKIFKDYRDLIASEVEMDRLCQTNFQELSVLLDLAVKESVDVLTLFTLPVLQRKTNKAIVLDKELLRQVDKQYNLHGLFLIAKHSAQDDSVVQMNFLITGQGKLIIGYNRNAVIEHPDYFFATGRYDYQELFVMDAKTDEQGNYGIYNIKGFSRPTADFNWMKGPVNVNIRSLSLMEDPDRDKKILVRYELLGTHNKIITRKPIEKRFQENQTGSTH